MFGFRKKKEIAIETEDVLDHKSVEAYLDAFMSMKRISPEKTLVREILSEKQGDLWHITIKAGFPGNLIGKGGATVRKLSSGLSKHLEKTVRVSVVY